MDICALSGEQSITIKQIDAGILWIAAAIERAAVSNERKYNALDHLYFAVANKHPHGWAADVLQTIARAMDKY